MGFTHSGIDSGIHTPQNLMENQRAMGNYFPNVQQRPTLLPDLAY